MGQGRAPVDDPALQIELASQRAWWRARLRVMVPLALWVGVALATLARLGFGRAPTGTLPLLIALVVTGIAVVVFAIPMAVRSMRELRGAFAGRRANTAAIAALQRAEPEVAEAALLEALPRVMALATRAVMLHNLGVAALQRGAVAQASRRMARARASGWLRSLQVRRHRAGFAQARAMVAIVAGDLDAARAELASARAGAVPRAMAPYVAVAELLLALRMDDVDAAVRCARSVELDALTPAARALAGLAGAWALERGGAPPDAVRAMPRGRPTPRGRPAPLGRRALARAGGLRRRPPRADVAVALGARVAPRLTGATSTQPAFSVRSSLSRRLRAFLLAPPSASVACRSRSRVTSRPSSAIASNRGRLTFWPLMAR
jgi:hypothetical protein